MASLRHRIVEILVSQRLASRDEVKRCDEEAVRSGRPFARVLVERGLVSEAALTALLAKELKLPTVTLSHYRMDAEAARLIPERLARRYHLVPLATFGDRLVVAMADPLNVLALDDLKAVTRIPIDPVLASEAEVLQAIQRVYDRHEADGQAPSTSVESPSAEGSAGEDEDLETVVAMLLSEDQDSEAPVVKVINLLIREAIRRRASDIHLEPLAGAVRVRYRIDGHLVEGYRLPKAVQATVLTRLKIMSGLDITESRIPQDGRFKVRLGEREVDFRVSVLPLTQGGKVVLRLLDRSSISIGLEQLGLLPASIEPFQRAIRRPYGMILVTGPTGSGKSTTLYALLHQLNDPIRNLNTVEDPVEYQLEGVTQVQVNHEIGLTFASGLRALLRQSPDVIMVGEIRDSETADIAMKASLAGQLVLSTLHTNDAPSAVTRLVDMGVEPFLVASSVNLIEAQRLVRRLCQSCRKPADPPSDLLERLHFTPPPDARFFEAGGCRLCHQTGFLGRMAVAEMCEVDEPIRELIVARAPSWKLREHAVTRQGMVPLRLDGLAKAAMGLTTLEEVLVATTEE